MDQLDGNRPLPFARDDLGRMVREALVEMAETDKEADRQIGEALARWTCDTPQEAGHKSMWLHVAELAQENERLRVALTRIMELGYHSLDPDVDKRMTELAREALK